MSNTNALVQTFVQALTTQISYRVIGVGIETDSTKSFKINTTDKAITITFKNEQETSITIPIPFVEKGVEFVEANNVKRPTCQYYIKQQDKFLNFMGCMNEIFLGDTNSIIPKEIFKSKTNFMQLIKFSYENNSLDYITYVMQKCINYIINKLPLHTTLMNSWAKNKMVVILDPIFEELDDPAQKHLYQVEKNKEFFQRGWTSLGLSDGSLADKNYMLTVDLRKLTPFGMKHHNPQRNLYSTLGMLGDEEPLLETTTMAELKQQGISRKGWNLFTLFVDIPDVWEDQIMVDISHKDKYITHEKTFVILGTPLVFKGDTIYRGDTFFIDNDEHKQPFKVKCDKGIVKSIKDIDTVIGGIRHQAIEITVDCISYLKEGTKITNMSANKGVIRMADLGYATNPVTGEKRKIDVIVSSKAVLKRKNYGQILEALFNNLNNEQPCIIPDDAETNEAKIAASLSANNFSENGTWDCETYVGNLKGICGKVFWGVTHDANDTVWDKKEIITKNSRGIREAGLKFSTIEFRALRTRFGADNAIEKEILFHATMPKDFNEMYAIIKHKLGEAVFVDKTINVEEIKEASTNTGTSYSKEDLQGTVLDKDLCAEGFLLKLPIEYQVIIGKNGEILNEGFPSENIVSINEDEVERVVSSDTIYVPYYNLRQPWMQENHLYGIGGLATNVNSIVRLSQRFINDDTDATTLSLLYRAIYSYYLKVRTMLGSKRGAISILGMSVRYPHSAKAVATLSNNLPPNTIEIHKSMAKDLNVKQGDIVLVERFPCLGFMSLRPQQVYVTDDDSCKYTIRASGNSLGSLTLDFDGDVLYIAAFRTEEARKALRDEWENPDPVCYNYIQQLNAKMGTPRFKEMDLFNYAIKAFEALNTKTHAEIVSKLTGVKSYTGPVVALAYNILRIMESSIPAKDSTIWAGIEVFMDKVANSVFKQKHGKKSLHAVVTEAVCTANEAKLIEEDFEKDTVMIVCDVIRQKATERNIKDLIYYHKRAMENNNSSFINRIVREENKLYFASRSVLNDAALLTILSTYDVVDVPSSIFRKINTTHINIGSGKSTGGTLWM
jgi:hypothetical protein